MCIIFNFLGLVVCLVLHQRQRHKTTKQLVYSESINDGQSTSKQSYVLFKYSGIINTIINNFLEISNICNQLFSPSNSFINYLSKF